jgi:hypothetical protein
MSAAVWSSVSMTTTFGAADAGAAASRVTRRAVSADRMATRAWAPRAAAT